MNLSPKQLLRIMPNCPADRADVYAEHLGQAMGAKEIDTVLRASCFLGQLAWESGELRYWVELSSGEQYEGREDLGNTQPGDGARYKGRGPIQLTGRANYLAAEDATGYPLVYEPDLVRVPEIGFAVAVWYWDSRHLNRLADHCDITGITKSINGGLNHLDRRRQFTYSAMHELRRTAKLV